MNSTVKLVIFIIATLLISLTVTSGPLKRKFNLSEVSTSEHSRAPTMITPKTSFAAYKPMSMHRIEESLELAVRKLENTMYKAADVPYDESINDAQRILHNVYHGYGSLLGIMGKPESDYLWKKKEDIPSRHFIKEQLSNIDNWLKYMYQRDGRDKRKLQALREVQHNLDFLKEIAEQDYKMRLHLIHQGYIHE